MDETVEETEATYKVTHEVYVDVLDDGAIQWKIRGKEGRTYPGDTFTLKSYFDFENGKSILHTISFVRPRPDEESVSEKTLHTLPNYED